MMIACPACKTRYAVSDSAIKAEGRTVRCAKCRHSWFQPGPETASDPLPPSDESVDVPAHSEGELQQDATSSSIEAPPVQTASPPTATPEPSAPDPEPETSRFDPGPLIPRRKLPFRLWAWIGTLLLLVVGAAAIAVAYWGLPDWAPVNRPVFGLEQPELRLDFPAARQELHRLANGTEFFNASGSVTNTGRTAQRVPPILIILRDAQDQIVYRWEVVPPKRTLSPGENMTINEAMADVPSSARFAEIGWKAE